MSLFNDYQPLHFVTVNQSHVPKLSVLANNCGGVLWLPENLTQKSSNDHIQYYKCSLAQHLQNIWADSQAIVCCLTIGAIVRLISPLLKDKKVDPAITVITPDFKYVISLVGGHQGKGDPLTNLLASQLNAEAIVTSASSALNLPAIDIFGQVYGWRSGKGDWNAVSGAITRQQPTLVKQTAGLTWWRNRLPQNHPFIFSGDESPATETQATVHIGIEASIGDSAPCVSWHPQVLWVGIGCERNTSFKLIESALIKVLAENNLAPEAIASLVSIDLKSDEEGILQLAQKWQLPFGVFTPEELKSIAVPTPSEIVAKEVGTPSVAEASALKGANSADLENNQGELILHKQIIKDESGEESGAITIAIAQSSLEYNPKDGELYLIGTGPGNIEYLTKKAQTALQEAEIIIGYGLYIDLISSLLRPEQIIESYNITQEKQRAQRAIDLAKWGLKVAVISSGDCGIYGMAGLVLEMLAQQDWDGKTPRVEVFSGITALQSLAARVGSPLMHDFCAISLSDLLTPWDVIEKRIVAAAMGDFVTTIYNPRSRTRQEQIVHLQKIFLEYRGGDTPVAIASSLGREDEQITITTLANMLDHSIDMLTTVMIGNSKTQRYQDLLITPRGYLK